MSPWDYLRTNELLTPKKVVLLFVIFVVGIIFLGKFAYTEYSRRQHLLLQHQKITYSREASYAGRTMKVEGTFHVDTDALTGYYQLVDDAGQRIFVQITDPNLTVARETTVPVPTRPDGRNETR